MSLTLCTRQRLLRTSSSVHHPLRSSSSRLISSPSPPPRAESPLSKRLTSPPSSIPSKSRYSNPLHQSPQYHPPLPADFGSNQLVQISDDTLSTLQSTLSHFRAPIRYAFAYGSGIYPQAGYQPSKSPSTTATGPEATSPSPASALSSATTPLDEADTPMLDFIFATTHPAHFHSINLAQNPSHYPFYMRLLGSSAVAWLQESKLLGAGVWFNAFCKVQGRTIKYGVISVDALCKDLIEWQTLYISGRMHKPIRILRDDPRVKLANQVNLTSALRVALLTLPETFTEKQLYERIAGLSYGGDPRMSVPGGENPRKVLNIVDAQMERFKGVYGRLLSELDGLAVVDAPDGKLHQDPTPTHRAQLARKLPKTLKIAIRSHYAPDQPRDDNSEQQEEELWVRIAGEKDLGQQLIARTSNITRRPALMQSIKGVITAGPVKSLAYGVAKIGKWRKGRQELQVEGKKED